MQIKTSELTGPALDYAVATAVCLEFTLYRGPGRTWVNAGGNCFEPSESWVDGGPLVEAEQIEFRWSGVDGKAYHWHATHQDIAAPQIAETMLTAGMRAIVAAKLGDTVDVPEELTHV